MQKYLLPFLGCVTFVLAAAIFWQYQKATAQLTEQVEAEKKQLVKDILQAQALGEGIFIGTQRTHLQTELVMQSIDAQNQFSRHYHSLFIENGKNWCLKTQLIYPQKKSQVFDQSWLASAEGCLP